MTNADGSTTDSTFTYNSDGSYSDMVVSTPAGGGASTTRTYDYNASGQFVAEQVKNPDGSTASYTYNSAGKELTGDVTNADSSTTDSTYVYNSDGSYSDTVVSSPAGGGASTTIVYDYNSSGQLVSETEEPKASNTEMIRPAASANALQQPVYRNHGDYWWRTSLAAYEDHGDLTAGVAGRVGGTWIDPEPTSRGVPVAGFDPTFRMLGQMWEAELGHSALGQDHGTIDTEIDEEARLVPERQGFLASLHAGFRSIPVEH